MKATGIVRRIDDLGRVVVPKEIRRTLRIREGDPLEIFTDREGEIILKKYSPIGEMGNFAKQFAESLAQTSGHMIVITDRDQVIAVAGGAKKELFGKRISRDLEEIMEERITVNTCNSNENAVPIIEGEGMGDVGEIICPILCEGDIIGSVAIISKGDKNSISITELKLAGVAANFLGRQMEA
ncbi:MAG: stage V sporulation protein T [Eubacterium sp.]